MDCLSVLGAIALGIVAFFWLQGIPRYGAWMFIAVYAAKFLSRRWRRARPPLPMISHQEPRERWASLGLQTCRLRL
jgi:hypothetical protein